jgi:hypothetical protein
VSTRLDRVERAYLKVLSRDLDLVELAVMELGEVAVGLIERLLPRSGVERVLVLVSPALQFANVISERSFLDEVLLEVRLKASYKRGDSMS